MNQPKSQVSSASYEAECRVLAVEMRSGAVLLVPLGSLLGLERAREQDLGAVSVGADGALLRWDSLGVQMTITALLEAVFGIATVTENSRRAGLVKSEAKAEAVRRNGMKGGRPRKHRAVTV